MRWHDASMREALDHAEGRVIEDTYESDGTAITRFTDGTQVVVTARYIDSGCPTCGGETDLTWEIKK